MFVKTSARYRSAWAVTAATLIAAFGVATCCALPLAIFGLGTATSLTMIGAWIAPYKGLVSIVAAIGIAGALS
jgi:hypothetical protein